MKIKYMCPVVGLVAVLLAVPALAQGYFHELPVASASPITSDGFLPSIHPDGSVVAYIDSAENAHLWDVWSGVEVDLPFDPGDYDKVSQCVWGDSILFCKASFRRSNRTNYVVAAYDYVGDKMDEYPIPTVCSSCAAPTGIQRSPNEMSDGRLSWSPTREKAPFFRMLPL